MVAGSNTDPSKSEQESNVLQTGSQEVFGSTICKKTSFGLAQRHGQSSVFSPTPVLPFGHVSS